MSWKYNKSELIIDIEISPTSPLFIQMPKDENSNKDDENNQTNNKPKDKEDEKTILEFVSYGEKNNKKYFIPGSSIKGVLRAHTEKVFYHLKGIIPSSDEENRRSKGECLTDFLKKLDDIKLLFGHLDYRGRFSVSDALFHTISEKDLEVRTNTAIDRFRGGVKEGALFNVQCLSEGTAKATINIKNPQKWEVFWLCFLLKDLNDGNITIGAKQSIGFGQVEVIPKKLQLLFFDKSVLKDWKPEIDKATEEGSLIGLTYNKYCFNSLDELAEAFESNWQEVMFNMEAIRS